MDINKSAISITIATNHTWADLSSIPLGENISGTHAGPNRVFDLITDALAWSTPALGFASDTPTAANLGRNPKGLVNANSAISGAGTAGDQTINTMEALCSGELRFNSYCLTILKHAGEDNGVVIKYGCNMQSLIRDETASGTCNTIMFYVTYSPEKLPQPDSESFDGQVTAQHLASDSTSLFNTLYEGHPPPGSIKDDEYFKSIAETNRQTISNDTWYRADTGGWADEHLATFDKSGNYIVNRINAQGAP